MEAEERATVLREAGPCPDCGTAAAKQIRWGFPAPGEREQLGDSVSWGSGYRPPVPPAYECGFCGQQYGMLTTLPPELQYYEDGL